MTGIVVIEDVTGDVSLLEVDGASGVTVGPVVVTIVVNAVKRNLKKNKGTVYSFNLRKRKMEIISSQSKLCLVPLIH